MFDRSQAARCRACARHPAYLVCRLMNFGSASRSIESPLSSTQKRRPTGRRIPITAKSSTPPTPPSSACASSAIFTALCVASLPHPRGACTSPSFAPSDCRDPSVGRRRPRSRVTVRQRWQATPTRSMQASFSSSAATRHCGSMARRCGIALRAGTHACRAPTPCPAPHSSAAPVRAMCPARTHPAHCEVQLNS
jgi:hypothetical protein